MKWCHNLATECLQIDADSQSGFLIEKTFVKYKTGPRNQEPELWHNKIQLKTKLMEFNDKPEWCQDF